MLDNYADVVELMIMTSPVLHRVQGVTTEQSYSLRDLKTLVEGNIEAKKENNMAEGHPIKCRKQDETLSLELDVSIFIKDENNNGGANSLLIR